MGSRGGADVSWLVMMRQEVTRRRGRLRQEGGRQATQMGRASECRLGGRLESRGDPPPVPAWLVLPAKGPNGAIIHYRATKGSCRTVTPNSVLLVDSGGQYDCGTTDVTRTLHTGPRHVSSTPLALSLPVLSPPL